jgi:putative ABC transport system permease protein
VAEDLAAIDGVEAVQPRLVLESGCSLPGGDSIVCQLIGMTTQARPSVNDVLIEEGGYFQAGEDQACLPEVHLADFYGIGPGDTIKVTTPGGNSALPVEGTAASAEFFIVSGERDFIASPRNYGVLFVPQVWLQEAFARAGTSNQFCFLVKQGSDASQVMASAEQALAPYGVLYASLGDETQSRQLLDLDVQGFKQIALFFPLLFLVVAALSIYMILTRLVHMQRRQIGTMMALGLGHRRITFHYLSYALLIGSVGAAAGLLVGYFLAGWLTTMYADSLGIPLVSTVMDWGAVLEGLLAALAACLLASVLPVRRILRFTPSQVMQEDLGEKKVKGHKSVIERVLPPLQRLSITFKMPLRNLTRDRRRAFLNIMGIVFALVLILVSLALMDSMNDIFAFYFDDYVRYDADAYFASPAPRSQAEAIGGLEAVKEADPYLYVPCRFLSGGKPLGDGLLQALPRDSELIGFYDTRGNRVQLPQQGAFLSNWFRDGLGVREGDTVSIETAVGSLDVEVMGFAKQLGGLTMFSDLAWIQDQAGTDLVNGALVTSAGPSGVELRDDLMQAEGVAGVEIPEFTREMMQSELMGVMYIFAGLMILFAVAMALALIYNTVSIAYLEREREVSVMMAMGSGMGRIAGMLTVENLLVAIAAVIPGMVAGYLIAVVMMKSFSTEFFSAPAVIRTVSYVVSIVVVLAVVLLAELPSLRRAGHLDLASAIRDHSR